MGNLALNASRADFFNVRFLDLNTKVTIRVVTDKTDPTYDERIERGAADRELIESLKTYGQRVPAEGFKEPGLIDGKQVVTLVDGRQRWVHIQQAWAELRAAGTKDEDLPPFRIIIKRFSSEIEKFEAAIVNNAHRWQDAPVVTARKVVRYLNLIGDDAQGRERARVLFNIKSDVVMENTLKLLNLNPDIQEKIVAGEITASAGLQMAHLNRAQQAAVVKGITPGATVTSVRAAARQAAGKKATPKVLSRSAILDRIVAIRNEMANSRSASKIEVLAARIEELHFVLGERS